MTSSTTGSATPGQRSDLRAGLSIELTVYGETLSGRIAALQNDEIDVSLADSSRLRVLRAPLAEGAILVSVEGGALSGRVTCWTAGNRLRMRLIGSTEFIQRRLHERFSFQVPAMISWTADSDGTSGRVLARTTDISFGGLRLAPQTTVWPSPGVSVQLMLECPDGPLRVQAEVLGKSADYGLRLRFTSTESDVLAAITRQIDRSRTSSSAL